MYPPTSLYRDKMLQTKNSTIQRSVLWVHRSQHPIKMIHGGRRFDLYFVLATLPLVVLFIIEHGVEVTGVHG